MANTIERDLSYAIRFRKDIEIKYRKFDGEISTRILSEVDYSVNVLSESHIAEYEIDDGYITGYCHLRDEQRTFKIERIIRVSVL